MSLVAFKSRLPRTDLEQVPHPQYSAIQLPPSCESALLSLAWMMKKDNIEDWLSCVVLYATVVCLHLGTQLNLAFSSLSTNLVRKFALKTLRELGFFWALKNVKISIDCIMLYQ